MNKYYEKHVIAFIDILGFKEHIEKTLVDESYAKALHNILAYLNNIKVNNYKGDYPENNTSGREISVFSDSIVISYPLTYTSAVFYLLLDVIHIQLDMLANGILLRGGITVGDLYHRSGVVYGPAMNEAYKLESKNAIYPRVVVDENTLVEGVKNGFHSPKEELDYILSLINIDEDKQLIVDFLRQWQEVDDNDAYRELLETTKDLIIKEINEQTSPNILNKYIWLKKYYNQSLDELQKKVSKGLYID